MVDDQPSSGLFYHNEPERRFLAFFDSLNGIAVQGYSPKDGVMYWNKASEKLYGFAFSEVLGRSLQSFICKAESDIPHLDAYIQAWFAGDLPQAPLELLRQRRDGGQVTVLTQPFSFPDESPIRVLYCIEFDLSAQKTLEFHLRRAASFDSITRLPNRLYFDQELGARIAEARRFKTSLGLFFIDLDGFKSVNDTFGHATGDRLLARAANRIASVLRHYDFVARLGGDEFVCILPGEGKHEAITSIALKLIEQLERPFKVNGDSIQVSASVGIALFPEDGQDSTSLLTRADAAMYQAKRDGKGRYRFFSPVFIQDLSRQPYHDGFLNRWSRRLASCEQTR